ncbi:MAG: glycosyltransferase family 4 protein [Candidatus Acidiferrum sp.]
MKILFVDLETEWRGGQNQALLLLTALNARGDTAELVAVEGSALGRRAAAKRVKVHFVGEYAARVLAAAKIFQQTQNRAFDVVHANEAHAVTAAWLAGAQRRAVFLISRRVGYPLSKGRVALARYKAAQRIIAISQWVAERLAASGAPEEKLVVIYEGVEVRALPDAEARKRARVRWGVAEETVLLGSVGVLLPDKGHELLIRALALLRVEFPDCKLLLAGAGPGRVMLEQLAAELGVSEMVVFAGFVADIETVYTALDVFLFPSFFEGLGTSLLAAMSYEIPSVAFNCCAFGEIIENGKSGLLVETGKVDEIVKAVSQLLRDREFARAVGQAARARIVEKFSSTGMVEQTLTLYRELCER